jgi:hypothetical protein
MLCPIFTLDYEIHGNGDGCPHALMVEPTNRMMDLFEKYGAKLTIMADVAEILKFKEYKETAGRDDYHYDAIASQLQDAIRRGHDVQLHLHASYFNARHEEGRWLQDWSEYNFAGLPLERLNEIVGLGKKYLEDLLKPVAPEYECIAFRAANWSVSPSQNVVRALLSHGIRIETSVFKYGQRNGIVSFDYSNAPSELVPWLVDESDICRHNAAGRLLEVPIYCERRWLGAFFSANRVYRAHLSRKHKFRGAEGPAGIQKGTAGKVQKVSKMVGMVFRRHAWKADFNQCTGRQLIGALRRASKKYMNNGGEDLPFVLIGHSKIFTSENERNLAPFLNFIASDPARFRCQSFRHLSRL